MHSIIFSNAENIRKIGSLIFGKKAKIHRIAFGPLAGRKIFISFRISPRMYFGIDEPWIAELAQKHARPGDIIYDIGAHVGYTCLLFANRVGEKGIVHAFELVPSVVEQYLKRTIEANGLHNVFVHNIGLSNREQDIELAVSDTIMTSLYYHYKTHRTELCTTSTLDKYSLDHHLPLPAIIKIDIEGAEVDCLLGGMRSIKSCLPLMIIEFHNKICLEKGFSLLTPLGYRLNTRDAVINSRLIESVDRFYGNVLCSPLK